ncbi:unnamed protein product, partial [Gongylonema pulchrum]|uniref:Uncharacterized protein n=1 Tax=Gongylonema pulchrum TaxID=637853 RepID=A0A183EY72_9BILA
MQLCDSNYLATSSSSSEKSSVPSNLCRLRKLIKWITVGVIAGSGTVYLYNILVPDRRELEDRRHYYSDWKLRAYCSLPLNAISRYAGGLASVRIPVWLRPTVFGLYVRAFDCRMDEAELEDLRAYPTLASFFNRS